MTQAGRAFAKGGSSNGRALSAQAQSSGQKATQRESGSMETINPFRARLVAWQTHPSSEDATLCQEKPKVGREEIKRFIGKLR